METPQKRILIVDDDKEVTRAMRMYFEQWGMEVRVAENGLRALEEIGVFQPNAVILDIFMPLLDGVKVCKFLRLEKRKLDIPIIVLTGHHDPEREKEILQAGANLYLTKPIDMAELLKHVQESITPGNAE